MKTESTKRIVKIIIDDKHRKSFPLFMKDHIPTQSQELKEAIVKTSKSMQISCKDAELIAPFVFDSLVDNFLNELKKSEKYIWELTVDNTLEGFRNVRTWEGKQRSELCFKNNSVKISCPEYLHKYAIVKLPNATSNY